MAGKVAPYLVVVQSSLFRRHDRRLAIPLVLAQHLRGELDSRLSPRFRIEGQDVVLATLDLASFPLKAFGPSVGSLAEQGDEIIAAIDLVISRAWD